MYIHWGGGPMAEYYKSGFVNDLTDMFNTYDHPDFIDAAVAQSSFRWKGSCNSVWRLERM